MQNQQNRDLPANKKRFRYIINTRFQLIFVLFMNAVSLLVIGIFYSSNLYFFYDLKKKALAKGVSTDHVFFRYLDLQFQSLDQTFMATGVIVAGALTVLGILFSHRIAGPLYRLTKHLDDIAKGATPKPVKFRKGDFFQEIPDAYNRHLAVIISQKKESDALSHPSQHQPVA